MTRTSAPPTGTPTPSTSQGDAAAPDRRASGRRLAWVVAGSVVIGPLAAAVLTVGVFAGAAEHVISGVGLVGLALGWAALAAASSALTTRPQRWAVVPATALGFVGVALLLLAPGNAALTAAGWIWPPALLALTVWVAVRAVRSLGVQAPFWLLSPLLVVLALAALGGGYEAVRSTLDRGAQPMPGQSYDVGGHRLHLDCTGSGGPTVVLESGMGATSSAWGHVQPALARTTRVCAYDRAGQGWSEDAPGPRDGVQLAVDLHTLLARAGERGPFVLAGHSVGGTYAMVYAALYPDDVAGLVLLDSATPDQFTVLPDYPGAYSFLRRATALLPSLGRLGVGRLFHSDVGATLPQPAAAQARAFASSPRDLRGMRDEVSVYPTVFRQAQSLTGIGSTPLVVVTATGGHRQAGWFAAQDRLTALSTNSSHRLAPATHSSLLADLRDSAVSVAAVRDVVQAARTQAVLPAR